MRKKPRWAELSVYGNLRENDEFRMRYDYAGEFFVREMEMKRNYKSTWNEKTQMYIFSRKSWLVRNLSLTGWYYNLSKYGQSVSRPLLY